MGIRLVVEVLDHAPADLTPAERLVLVVIAENANDITRQGWPGMGTLTRRTGLTPRGVRAVLARLAERGHEVRVALGKDARGRPVYSGTGKRTTYQLPRFAAGGTVVPPEGGTTLPPDEDGWRHERVNLLARDGQAGGTTMPPFPSRTLKEPSAARARDPHQIVIDATDATAEEARAVVVLVEQTDRPRNLAALLRHLAARGDLSARLESVRADRQRQDVAAAIKAARRGPQCLHGEPGGASLHPTSGQPMCALCRAAVNRASA